MNLVKTNFMASQQRAVMPPIHRYSCNECEFELPSGWGGYTYAVDNLGKRIVCPHPDEDDTIFEVTGVGFSEAFDSGRAGTAQYCVCLECLKQFDLDFKRDSIVCPNCSSTQVCSLRQLVGKQCPRCKVGIIEEGSTIRWKLDPDWEQLPVPHIVKDLNEFVETRQVSSSLRKAYEVAERFDPHNFLTVAIRLLGWWEGDYFSKNQEPKESEKMEPQWTWCKALPGVLQVTPDLAELIVIEGNRCRFADSVSPEVRRGIKNYLRKHRKNVVWT